MTQYVYVIEGWQHVKIGQTEQPHKRVRPLETQGNWLSGAFCFYAVVDMAKAESKLFRRFAKHRTDGEWFDIGFVAAVDALREEQARQAVEYICENMQEGARPTPQSVRDAAQSLGVLLCKDANIVKPLKDYLKPPTYHDFLQVLFSLRAQSAPSIFETKSQLLCRTETLVAFFKRAANDGHVEKAGGVWRWPEKREIAA